MSFKILSFFFAVLLSASVTYSQGRFRRVELTSNPANPVETKGGPTSARAPSPEIKRLYKEAVKYADAGLYRQAAETFSLALNMAPTYADAYYGLGQAYYDQQHWRKAINSLERALELNPKDQNTRDLLNRARLMLEKPRSTSPVAPVQVEGERVALKAEDSVKSPGPKTAKSPGPTTTKSPKPTTAKSPEPTTAKSPEPTTAKSPEPTTAKSPAPITTKAPEPTTTKAPAPITTKSPEPTTTKSPEPTTTKSPEPTTAKSPEPTTTKSPEPTTTKSPEPTTAKLPEPTTAKLPEPTTTKSPAPITTKSLEPTTMKSPAPATVKSPAPTTAKLPEPTTAKLPEPTTTKSPEPTTTKSAEPTTTKSVEPPTMKSPEPTTTKSAEPTTTKLPEPTTTKSAEPTTTKSADPTTTKSPEPTTTKPPEPTTTKPPEPTTTKSNISANELKLTKMYRVGPNDVLDVRLNNSSSPQSTLFTVTPSGFLEYPVLVEPVEVNGLAVEEIAAKIEAELTRLALADKPKVQVGVRDYASHTILISGLVKDPGTKILRREAVPLYVVLADAQPLPEALRATILRNDSNETFEINLASSTDMNMHVRPGDVITLQPNEEQFLYVGGAVKSPGEKVYRRGLTLMQVILAAGGVSPEAKEVRLGRDDGKGFLVTNQYKLKDIDAGKERDPIVRPGDRIMVVE